MPDEKGDGRGGPSEELDVFVVGGTGIDTNVRVPALPLPMKDTILVSPIREYVGHTGNGVAMGCHALGLRTKIVDVIGDDDSGHLIRRTYDAEGLPYDFSVHPSGTRRSVNLVDPSGHRVSLYDPRHPFDFRPPATLYQRGIERARHVHVSIMNWARHALASAVEAGRSTSTDLHDWDGQNAYHRDFAEQADIVFMSAVAVGDRLDAVVDRILERGRAYAVVVTTGADGCRLTIRDGPTVTVPAARLSDRPVVDTNGPGIASSPRSSTRGSGGRRGRTRPAPAT